MRADRSQPIPPLSPASIQLLGEPESVLVAAGGRLDHRIKAWLLGVGIVATGSAAKRETQVRIWILPEGVLLTNITIRQTSQGGSSDSSHGQFHETPQGALDWLIRDGNGKLGTASREAWVMACNRFPLMRGMDTDDAPDDPLAALNQGLPAVLACSLADGTARLSVEFAGPFRIEGSHYQRPCTCTWLNGLAVGPDAGSLKVTFAAGAELLATTPSARWDRIHQALRRKYVLASSTFIGSDGGLTITTADLNR